MMSEAKASSSVTGKAVAMSEATEVRDDNEMPRFPLNSDPSHDPYWRKNGSPTP